ncbi:MAG: hypothetical protein AAF383_13995 [Cyanobacteria bacterium P01_A01_bin.83]
MSLTKLLIIVLQLMMIGRLSELSGTAFQTQNYGVEIGWDSSLLMDNDSQLRN